MKLELSPEQRAARAEFRAFAAAEVAPHADRFDREERYLLQPLALRRYTSLVRERPAGTTARRPPRPLVTVEKRSLAAYAQLTGGAA